MDGDLGALVALFLGATGNHITLAAPQPKNNKKPSFPPRGPLPAPQNRREGQPSAETEVSVVGGAGQDILSARSISTGAGKLKQS
jgi:hypothetical protein